jgi:acetyltransferase
MIESLSPATAEYRFFGPIKEVTKSMLVRYCHIDYDREIALAAIREPKGKKKMMMLGVARLTIETANVEEGEFAIVVRDAYQRKGIGSKLMDALIQAARDRRARDPRLRAGGQPGHDPVRGGPPVRRAAGRRAGGRELVLRL